MGWEWEWEEESGLMVKHMANWAIFGSKAEHECTCGWPRSVPVGISNSKCHTWIHAGFSHKVTWSCKSKTCGFLGTCGSTGTQKYLQVLSILNRDKVVKCQHKYMWNKILLRHCVTLWQNQIWLDRPCTSPSICSLPLTPTPIPHQKHSNLVSYSSQYQKLIKCSCLDWYYKVSFLISANSIFGTDKWAQPNVNKCK